MPVDAELRLLEIDIPAPPQALARLSLLLADEALNLPALAGLIEGDMALAAAVLRAVNSSLFGLTARVQSVQQAITYLGTREVAAVTFEIGLRAVFPPAPELRQLWQRAARRGVLMGSIAAALDIDRWAAHSAGLFEECGKAVLFRHAQPRYREMLAAAADETALLRLERAAFGVGNDKLGAALCESWGLASAAVASVRDHVKVQATRVLPPHVPRRAICALSALAHALMTAPATLEAVAFAVAPQCELDPARALHAARTVAGQLVATAAHC